MLNKKNKLIYRSILLVCLSLFLGACGNISDAYDQFISDRASEVESETTSSVNESEESDQTQNNADIRLVPEYNQVMQEFKKMDSINVGEVIFETSNPFSHQQDNFSLTVDQMTVLEVEEADESLMNQFNFEDNPGGLVVMNVSIYNPSQSSIFFPIEDMKLSYREASQQSYLSSDLYPLETGNLYDILLNSSGEIGPEMTVEGYLVYGLGEDMLNNAIDTDHLVLSIYPPSLDKDSIIAVDDMMANEEIPLYLPLSEETEIALTEKERFIEDRLTTEWWGEKTLLAEDFPNETMEEDDVSIQMEHIQIADFEPFEEYEEAFRNFAYGQVIVTMEYVVTNNSDQPLLPIDGDANLVIAGDDIMDDYVLINQLNGETLMPGESKTVIKSFALDKMRYYESWEGQDIYIAINVPEAETEDLENAESEAEAEEITTEDLTVSDSNIYYFEFTYSPDLMKYVNSDMEIVDSPPEIDSTSDEEDVSDPVEATDQSDEMEQQ